MLWWWYPVAGAVAILLLLAGVQFFFVGGSGEARWPFHALPLMSRPELILYERLVRALPDHLVLAQVQLSRVIGVDEGEDERAWFNRVSRMSLDFVICTFDASVVAAIELDDSSHLRADRQEADARKDYALASAGVRMVRWHVKAIPDIDEIRATFPAPKPARGARRAAPRKAANF